MIVKIAKHYGYELTMELEGEIYDATVSLELFRANEKINATKRRVLAECIDRDSIVHEVIPDKFKKAAVYQVIISLAEQNKMVIYDTKLSLKDFQSGVDESFFGYVVRVITHLFTLGKLDIDKDIRVRFTGDIRALKDIELLAENGYGEDKYGNNIPLPKELLYLRK
jgi:hypothetical protein